MKDTLYCEDNELKIKCGAKYALYNLLYEVDKGFIEKLHKELEYNEE